MSFNFLIELKCTCAAQDKFMSLTNDKINVDNKLSRFGIIIISSLIIILLLWYFLSDLLRLDSHNTTK